MASIQAALTQAEDDRAKMGTIQPLFDEAQTAMTSLQSKSDPAVAAGAKVGTSSTDAENSAAAGDVIKARDEMKVLGAL